ncbi:MAG: 2-oxoglutarate dehydrogenase complex dihydrolipoyllysine-residue succinyltransferase [Tepidisphaeraceae bacterium]
MPIVDIKVPSAGESVTEVTLIKWNKSVGEYVNALEGVAEAETDKANTDINSESAGVLVSTLAKPGDVVKVGAVIAKIDTDGKPSTGSVAKPSSAPAVAQSAAPTPTAGVAASVATGSSSKSVKPEDLSPATRRVVAETGVDASKITGTGKDGRLTKEDVEKAAAKPAMSAVEPPAPRAAEATRVPPPPPPGATIKAPAGAPAPVKIDAKDGVRRTPMSKIRKRIAETLVSVKQRTAMLTTFNEVDMTAVMALRGKYKEGFEKKHGVGLGFMSFFVKACTIALKEFERVNGQIDGDDIVLFDHVHMGVAVSTERGLMVPVLKHADKMSFAQIESEIKRLAIGARDNKLALDELGGGTFTITNGGVFGSLLSTPIINGNQSAILGMHTIQNRPVAAGDKVEVHPMMYLALSYDHRIVDGKESVSFLVKVKNLLEDPSRLLLDV